MGSGIKAHAAWLVHALGVGRNPLRRPIDRIAAAVSLLLLMGALIAVPTSAMFASSVYHDLTDRAAVAARQNHPVTAVVVSSPDLSMPASEAYNQEAVGSTAVVEWHTGSQPHRGTVRVPDNTRIGDTATVWVDPAGNRVPPPASEKSVLASAVFAAVLLLAVLEFVTFALIAGTQHAARRIGMRAWGREWRYFQTGGSWSQT